MDDTNPDFVGSQNILNVGMMLDNNPVNSNLEFAIRASIDPEFIQDSIINHISQEFTEETNERNFFTNSNFQEHKEIYSRYGHNAEVLYPINKEGNFNYMENGSNGPKREYCVYEFQHNGLMPDIYDKNLSLQIPRREDNTSGITSGSDSILSMHLNELKIYYEFDSNQIQNMHQRDEAILMNNQQQDYANCKEIKIFNNEQSAVEKILQTNYLAVNEIQLSAETQTSSYFTLEYNHTLNDNQNGTMRNSLEITEIDKNSNSFKHGFTDFSTNAKQSYNSELNYMFLSKDYKYSAESETIFPVSSNLAECTSIPTVIPSLNQQNESNHRKISFPGDVSSKELQQTCNLNEDMTNRLRQKRHKCEFCTKMFRLKFDLMRHKRIHTGDKPFICNICHKAFTQKSNLKKHVRIHTGEKPFSCSICSKAFSQKGTLKYHFRTHSKEKPYSFNSCDAAFSYQNSLKRHMLTHANETPI